MDILLWGIIVLGVYVLGNFFLALKIYKEYNKYISPLLRYDEKTQQMINLHDLYPEFRKTDKVSFNRIFFGLIFFTWWKISFALIFIISLCLSLKYFFFLN